MSNLTLSPSVSVVSGLPVVSSLTVAEHFEKQHKNVLRQIDALRAELDADFNGLNFEPVEYLDAKGENRPAYNLSRDGFTLLAMGFTGPKALAWKVRYIEAFNAMEAQLRGIFTHPDADPREQPSFRLNPVYDVPCPPTMFLDFCGNILRVVDLDGERWWSGRDVAGACKCDWRGVRCLKMHKDHYRMVCMRSAWGNRSTGGKAIVISEDAMLDWVQRSGKQDVAQLVRFVQFAAQPHPKAFAPVQPAPLVPSTAREIEAKRLRSKLTQRSIQ